MGSACVNQNSSTIDATTEEKVELISSSSTTRKKITTEAGEKEKNLNLNLTSKAEEEKINTNANTNTNTNTDDDSTNNLPPPPPKNAPIWSKLNKQQRCQLTKNDPMMAIESLDLYWKNKITKYIINNKLPMYGSLKNKKADKLWKNMFNAQKSTQKRRRMIWDEYIKQYFNDLLPDDVLPGDMIEKKVNDDVNNDVNDSVNDSVSDDVNEEKSNQTSSPIIVPKGMIAMRKGKPLKGIAGITSKNSSSLKEKSKVSKDKRKVQLLKVLENTIKRMRVVSRLLKKSIAGRPNDNGREILYKRCLDHLLILEEYVQPYRKAKNHLDSTIINLYKMQIMGHEQQMRQWAEEEEKEEKREGNDDDDETEGLLSSGGQLSSDNPMLGT
jgi:hypothetical protein